MEVPCGHKGISKNWYFELALARTIDYPPRPHKPIGVFHRTEYQTFRYTILVPNDESYAVVQRFLNANYGRLNRPANQLRRAIEPTARLQADLPNHWFFDD